MTFATATATVLPLSSPLASPAFKPPHSISRSSPIFLPRRHLRLSALRSSPSNPPEPIPEKEVNSNVPSKSMSTGEVEEIKEKLAVARAETEEKRGFWGGVADEVAEIEWPVFGKVLGTTGVVISVIVGSSIALLTVNAVLAEISDKVFVGKGVQDFLS